MDDEELYAREMFDPLDVYEPSSEIWIAIREFINALFADYYGYAVNLTCKLVTHDTEPSILEVFRPEFYRDYPLVKAAVVMSFTFKYDLGDRNPIRKYALLLLDDNRKAYSFVPTGFE